ncbi:MAG: PQQ-dependent sugar dehydrogenase [Thermoleophilia bacterium]|nr:PQQ-dependent sugar dehydrogenase [Thermoleophilia bacterium]
MVRKRNLAAIAVVVAASMLAGVADSDAKNVKGTSKADRIAGTSKADTLTGGRGNDLLTGRGGRDRLRGNAGRDQVFGGAGRDRLWGGAGPDRIHGGTDPDRVFGGAGRDVLYGGLGADRLYGGPGDDRLHGGLGSDRMWGGTGDDRFLARDRRRDTIACGAGGDTVLADRFDLVSADCERVVRPRSTGLPGLAVLTVATGLSSPLLVTGRPGDARLYVVLQGGEIRILNGTSLVPQPFLNLSSLVSDGNEQGLLGLAFHPQHAQNGLFYVNYTDRAGTTQVVEYRATPGGNTADASSARTLLSIPQFADNHNGGHLAFGPDGMLYISTGDGGGSGDPQNNGQDATTLLGGLLRIDVTATAGAPYTIPSDNPFVGQPGARGELWSIGLRNPWRFSFDPASGNAWIADVGQNQIEEIDKVTPTEGNGANFGWNRFEGTMSFDGRPLGPGTYHPPVAQYPHSGGNCSVTGGYVYRGSAAPVLSGRYLYGDFCTGRVWLVAAEGPAGTPLEITGALGGPFPLLRSFGRDNAGELYVAAGDTVFRIVGA